MQNYRINLLNVNCLNKKENNAKLHLLQFYDRKHNLLNNKISIEAYLPKINNKSKTTLKHLDRNYKNLLTENKILKVQNEIEIAQIKNREKSFLAHYNNNKNIFLKKYYYKYKPNLQNQDYMSCFNFVQHLKNEKLSKQSTVATQTYS